MPTAEHTAKVVAIQLQLQLLLKNHSLELASYPRGRA
jgi:hypothetical protein